MTFRPRPYDPEREDPRTPAQREATMRNFEVFKLRGLWSQSSMLREPFRSGVRALIDADLLGRGALAQADQQAAQRAKRLKKRQREGDARICDGCDLPWRECECLPF